MTVGGRGLPILSPRSILSHLRSSDRGIVGELGADGLKGSLSIVINQFFWRLDAYIVQLKADLRFDERHSPSHCKGN